MNKERFAEFERALEEAKALARSAKLSSQNACKRAMEIELIVNKRL